ncbi:MAG: hypothetical protein QG632_833, partial [Candidatus Dependentiae bacterium]|nr:hypothetical protein [Candidatus Dependentiae bacterium]
MPRFLPIIFGIFLAALTSQNAALPEQLPDEINDLSYNCYQLECLWYALYGAGNPLLSYVETYKTAIKEYSKRCCTIPQRATLDAATELVTAQLQDQFKQVRARAQELLDQYELIPLETKEQSSPLTITPPSAYSAVPLRNLPTATQDATLKQVLTALQQLQTHQQVTQGEPHPGTLKEQLALFAIGIAFLGTITYFVKKRLSKNSLELRAKTATMLTEIEAPHAQSAPCGMQA